MNDDLFTSAVKDPYRISSGLLGIIGLITVPAGVLLYGRWGFSPLLLGFSGIFCLPAISYLTSSWLKSWRGQLVLILSLPVAMGGVERWAASITSDEAFARVFGRPIPAGVTDVEALKQYYDGYIITVSFHANKNQLVAILSGHPFKPDDATFGNGYQTGRYTWTQCWRFQTHPWVEIAHPGWPDPPPPMTDVYHYSFEKSGYYQIGVDVFWNSTTGQTYVIYNEH